MLGPGNAVTGIMPSGCQETPDVQLLAFAVASQQPVAQLGLVTYL